MTDTIYNFKITKDELQIIHTSLEAWRNIIYEEISDRDAHEGDEEEKEIIKSCNSLQERIDNGDYTKICWGKKANQQLKDKIKKLDAENKELKERLQNQIKITKEAKIKKIEAENKELKERIERINLLSSL